jgi:hypothetical protein
MVSPSYGNHFSRGSTLERKFQIGRGFGMIASSKRLEGNGDGEENLALDSRANKGKGKGSKGNSEGENSQSSKKKDFSKIKCFAFQKSGHYPSQCPKKKNGQGNLQYVATSAENQLDEFAAKFEKEFTLASCISTRTITKGAWFLDSDASHHITKSRELFCILKEDSGIHVELGGDAKYAMKGEGTILFQRELGGSFEARDVLYVPALKKNFLSVSVMEDRGFVVMFKKGKVLVCPEGSLTHQ